MNDLKTLKFSSFQECKEGGIVVPLKFPNVESVGLCISNLIDAVNLIAEQGENFDHKKPEEILTPLRAITDVLKGLYCESLLYDVPIIDKLRNLQKDSSIFEQM